MSVDGAPNGGRPSPAGDQSLRLFDHDPGIAVFNSAARENCCQETPLPVPNLPLAGQHAVTQGEPHLPISRGVLGIQIRLAENLQYRIG